MSGGSIRLRQRLTGTALSLFALTAAALAPGSAAAGERPSLILRNVTVIDGTGKAEARPQDIAIADGRITEVASTAGAAPAEPATEAKPAAGTDTTATQPAATSGAAAASAASGPQKHVIAKGDTLWDLAKSFYGEGALWKKISEANGKPAPRALHVGTELEIPAK